MLTLQPANEFYKMQDDVATDQNSSNLAGWVATSQSDEFLIMTASSTGIATDTHTTNNVDTFTLPPTLDYLVNVTYLYALPEPVSLLLLAVGAVPLLRRRRQCRRA